MVLKIIGIFFLVVIVVMGVFVVWTLGYHKKLKAVPVNNIDLAKVKDGSYEGRWDAGFWSVTVQAKVADHKITELTSNRGKIPITDMEKELLGRIIKKQSLEVDAIAGATITTKSVLKSTELALEKGLEQ